MSLYVGIDVSKAALDVAFGSDGDVVRVANDENGIGELVGQVVKAGPALVVLEATGGYEYLVAAALAGKEVPRSGGQSATGARLRQGHRGTGQDRQD